ncbi:MAG: aminoacyl-tRNA hydrolase [Firmicutes bacterium]|nr:aminoacyl-tRNA hydrolase [Bacillota bacterium]
MKLIIGLGNIGEQYKHTYHNVGFLAVEALAIKLGAVWEKRKKCDAIISYADYNGERVLIAKPTTFMNRSGQAVEKLRKYFKIKQDDILVLFDDIDIEKGTIRYREKGSSGTHNGMRDIVYYLGEDFKRIKIGIGRPRVNQDLANFVLSIIPRLDKPIFDEAIDKAVDRVMEFITMRN